MPARIHTLRLGLDQCYIIQDKGTIMVDGGAPGKMKSFQAELERISVAPQDVRLLVLTHGHWDHIGCAGEIKELTGAPIAMHRADQACLENAMKFMPPGVTPWGVVLEKVVTAFLAFIHIRSASVDLVIGDQDISLEEYGIAGRVIHTPGHSPGSVTVLLNTGEAFVGDTAASAFLLRQKGNLPVFAEDLPQLKESWRRLLTEGAKTIYPAHGDPFPADIIQKMLG